MLSIFKVRKELSGGKALAANNTHELLNNEGKQKLNFYYWIPLFVERSSLPFRSFDHFHRDALRMSGSANATELQNIGLFG